MGSGEGLPASRHSTAPGRRLLLLLPKLQPAPRLCLSERHRRLGLRSSPGRGRRLSMGRERWRAFEREREVRKEKPAAFLSGFCHGLATEMWGRRRTAGCIYSSQKGTCGLEPPSFRVFSLFLTRFAFGAPFPRLREGARVVSEKGWSEEFSCFTCNLSLWGLNRV
jgi:hypothetical protein